MSEIRSFNDMRRSRFCRPGAERDELVVCDLGTPWCAVAHDEDQEATILASPSVAADQALKSILWELERRSCSIDHIGLEAEHERWTVRYRDRWNGPTMIYVHFPPEPTQRRWRTVGGYYGAVLEGFRDVMLFMAPFLIIAVLVVVIGSLVSLL